MPNQISYNHGHGFKSLLTKRKKNKVLLRGSGHATFYYEKQGPGKHPFIFFEYGRFISRNYAEA